MTVRIIHDYLVARARTHQLTNNFVIRPEWGTAINDRDYRKGTIEIEPDPAGATTVEDYQGENCERVKHSFSVRFLRAAKSRSKARNLVLDMIEDFKDMCQTTNDNLEQPYVLKGQMRWEPVVIAVVEGEEVEADFNVVSGTTKMTCKEYLDPGARYDRDGIDGGDVIIPLTPEPVVSDLGEFEPTQSAVLVIDGRRYRIALDPEE